MSGAWAAPPLELAADEALVDAVVDYHRRLYASRFSDDGQVNHRLPVTVRALRRLQTWRLFLLLTPWMLARIWVSDEDPGIAVPAAWLPAVRSNACYTVLGPPVELELLGRQRAHLNYAPALGHYLLQPLVLAMQDYTDADAVFAAWDDVVRTRQATMERLGRDCPWQREVSRREFFGRFRERLNGRA